MSIFNKKNFFFIILFFIHSIALSKNINFAGLSKLSLDDLQSLTSVDINKDQISDVELDLIIRDLYLSDLIYDVDVNSDDLSLNISIIENDIVENIYINGNIRVKDSDILEIINSKISFYLNKEDLTDDISMIRGLYNSMGYIDASVNVKKEQYSENRINLIFEINEGPIYKISNVLFFGNANFSDKFLYSKVNTKSLSAFNIFTSGSNFVEELFNFDLVSLETFYKQKGFFDVDINYKLKRKRSSKFELIYYINEGERYQVEEIKYFSEYFDSSNFNFEKRKIDFEKEITKNDSFFDYLLVSDYIESLNQELFAQGIFKKVFTHTFDKIDDKNILNFYEIELETRYIDKVIILGNSITKDKTLRSKIETEPGDIYNEYKVEKDANSLNNLKYVNQVKADNTDKNDLTDVTFVIDENKKTGNFMIGGSYSADVGLGFALNLKDSNFRGSGNELDFQFNGNTEKVLYKIAYNSYGEYNSYQTNSYSISNEEIDLSGSFGYKIKSKSLGYTSGLQINENLSSAIGIVITEKQGYDPVINIDIVNDNIDKFNQVELKFNLNYDTTNDIFFPTNGIYNNLNFTLAPESLSKDAFYKILLETDIFKNFKDSDRYIFFANNFGITESFNSNLKTINAFSLGGSNFKGFEYRGIGPTSNGIYLGGNRYFTSTIGYGGSFLFDEKDNINLRLFYSIGSIWDSDYTTDNNFKLRSSAGISLDFLSQVGPISLSYAIPLQKEIKDISRQFNFIIGTSF